jgi:hypothetical protein
MMKNDEFDEVTRCQGQASQLVEQPLNEVGSPVGGSE